MLVAHGPGVCCVVMFIFTLSLLVNVIITGHTIQHHPSDYKNYHKNSANISVLNRQESALIPEPWQGLCLASVSAPDTVTDQAQIQSLAPHLPCTASEQA